MIKFFKNKEDLPQGAEIVDFSDDETRELDTWVYYPWRNCAVHALSREKYEQVRTSRNKNLITEDEQKKFSNFKIGIAGLNVGNPGAVCIALEGGSRSMKLADNDVLAFSNLNRFRAGLPDLGLNKAVLTARQIYEADPYYNLEVFPDGVTPDNIENFLLNPKIDLLIEETDNLKLKIEIREIARKNKIPVLMVTGNGPNIIIDIERFDLEPQASLLNGYLKQDMIEKVKNVDPKTLPTEEKILMARDFMGKEFLVPRLQESFLQVGKTLAGIPQIAESSFLRGAALCYFVRAIATGESVPSGRYNLRLDTLI